MQENYRKLETHANRRMWVRVSAALLDLDLESVEKKIQPRTENACTSRDLTSGLLRSARESDGSIHPASHEKKITHGAVVCAYSTRSDTLSMCLSATARWSVNLTCPWSRNFLRTRRCDFSR